MTSHPVPARRTRRILAMLAILASFALFLSPADAQQQPRFEVTVGSNVYLGDSAEDDPFTIVGNGPNIEIGGCIASTAGSGARICFDPITASQIQPNELAGLVGRPLTDAYATGGLDVITGGGFSTSSFTFLRGAARFESNAVTVVAPAMIQGLGLCAPECSIPRPTLLTLTIVDQNPGNG